MLFQEDDFPAPGDNDIDDFVKMEESKLEESLQVITEEVDCTYETSQQPGYAERSDHCLTTIVEQNHESCTPNIHKQGELQLHLS